MTIYLYKKTHNKTGLQYLGKTTKDPFKYKGSGLQWVRHIKKHGYDVTTEILRECHSNEEVTEWGLYYSTLWNVTTDKNWANLTEERGEGGAINKGKTVVKDRYGNITMVSPDAVKHGSVFNGIAKGTVTVKDRYGNNYRVSLDDPRYLSGELVNNRTKMCYVKDSDNNEYWLKYRDYIKEKENFEYISDCPLNDYEGYAKTAKGAEKRKGKSYHTPEQIEKVRRLGKNNAKPKEVRVYTCVKCRTVKEKTEYCHHPVKDPYRCNKCLPGRPKKIKYQEKTV